jgi:hypothetical protein
MHKIDSSTAVPSMPAANPVGTPGWFAHGSSATGTPFTVLTSDWANAVQAELINVVEAAGITLDKTQDAQLLAALAGLPVRITGSRGVATQSAGSTASLTWTIGEIIAKTALSGLTYFGSSLSLSINLGTVGIGGMDTGSAPVTGDVSVYAAYNPTTTTWGVFACAGTTSNGPIYTGSNAPSGYTATCLLYAGVTNSSRQFTQFYQRDRTIWSTGFTWAANGNTVTNTSPVATTNTNFLPSAAITCGGTYSISSSVSNTLYISGDAIGTGQQEVGSSIVSSADDSSYVNLPLMTPKTLYYNIAGGTATLGLNVNTFTF